MDVNVSKIHTTPGHYVAKVKRSPSMGPSRIIYIPEAVREKSQIAELLVIPDDEHILKVGEYILFENWSGRSFPGIEDGILLERDNIVAQVEI